MNVFCHARNDDADTVCSRRDGHEGHHCDSTERFAWTEEGEVSCLTFFDHGQPPNRAARRGNVTHPQRSDLVRKVIKGGRRR